MVQALRGRRGDRRPPPHARHGPRGQKDTWASGRQQSMWPRGRKQGRLGPRAPRTARPSAPRATLSPGRTPAGLPARPGGHPWGDPPPSAPFVAPKCQEGGRARQAGVPRVTACSCSPRPGARSPSLSRRGACQIGGGSRVARGGEGSPRDAGPLPVRSRKPGEGRALCWGTASLTETRRHEKGDNSPRFPVSETQKPAKHRRIRSEHV